MEENLRGRNEEISVEHVDETPGVQETRDEQLVNQTRYDLCDHSQGYDPTQDNESPRNYLLNLQCNIELIRLSTFSCCPPNTQISPIFWAREGFVYIGDDTVQCYFCDHAHGCLQASEKTDLIRNIHNPSCPMVTEANCNNVSINEHLEETGISVSSLLFDAVHRLQISCQFCPNQDGVVNTHDHIPDSTPGNTPSSIHDNTNGSTHDNTNGSTLDNTNGSIPDNTNGSTPDNTNGNIPDNTNGSTPDNTNGSTPDNTNGSTHDNTNGSTPDNTNGSTPDNTNGSTPDNNIPSLLHRPRESDSSLTYEQLSIIMERPIRPEQAFMDTRLATFREWPREHHISKEDLAKAGFYYAGCSDCTRCFYCGGGLMNWKNNDNVWVEHARWFPRCAFMRLERGQEFIDAVKRLHDQGQKDISFDDVIMEMNGVEEFHHDPLHHDPAVLTLAELGFDKELLVQAAATLRSRGTTLSSDKIMDEFHRRNGTEAPRNTQIEVVEQEDRLREMVKAQREECQCKLCFDREVEVIFLPCGHLCVCRECAAACNTCPVCRQVIRGIVRVFINSGRQM